jgi:hypothetical protein
MDIQIHKQEFDRVIRKYNLKDKADEIADYITKRKNIDPKEFAVLFNIDVQDAQVLLSFIDIGLKFKEKHIDPHRD